MKRLLLIAAFHAMLGALWAQKIVSTHVYAEPCGAFWVDGLPYYNNATFLWPEGSKHTLTIETYHTVTPDIRCKANMAWTDGGGAAIGQGGTIVITVNAALAEFKFTSSREYLVRLLYYQGGGTPPGTVSVNNNIFSGDASIWVAAGAAVSVQAFPAPGFVFTGWGGVLAKGSQAFTLSFSANAPMAILPLFSPAIGVKLFTSPTGLAVLADRTHVPTPATMEWGIASQHTLSPLSPQLDAFGAVWVFDSWSNGGAETQTYTVSLADSITATYAPGVRVGFTTVPAGLKLVVDGRDNWPNYNFVWKLGSKHTLAAPAEQANDKGRKYVFRGWSNGSTADQEFVADGGSTGLIALYDPLGQLTVTALPSDITVTLDGAACRTPCVAHRAPGATAKIGAPAQVGLGESSRLEWDRWADGGPRERTWTASSDAQTLVALYQTSHRVQAAVDPSEGGSVRVEPPSPDGFYLADTEISFTVEPKSGYRFRYWDGDLAGRVKSGTLRASGPLNVRAVLEKIPYVAPVVVRNAAGETPVSGVAPGSIVSITGANLAPDYVQGPDSPLAQSIAGVSVQVADRVLPLFFVSPEEIKAQLPSDLPEGTQFLTVRGENQPDATAKFFVQRNAPGLFWRTVETRQFALSSHQDGSVITEKSPARRGETVVLLGTGLGPFQAPAPDGLAITPEFDLRLADPVEIVVGGQVLQAVSAMAAPGYVGITAVRFKVADELPRGETLEVVVRVNGQESNKVLLPIE